MCKMIHLSEAKYFTAKSCEPNLTYTYDVTIIFDYTLAT